MQQKFHQPPITEAIILAGGQGTRLREAVPDLPKCMAPVSGTPFIAYVIDALRMQGIHHFVFSLGYMWEVIEAYLKEQYPTLLYSIVVEKEPLGTGGAILLALQSCHTDHVLVTNGDTLFKIDVQQLHLVHTTNNAACTLALKPMEQFERYGVVVVDENNLITSFLEKKFYEKGLINGGIYLLDKNAILHKKLPPKFSFEKDYLEKFTQEHSFFGCIYEGYFIDIGIPADYIKAQKDLQRPLLDLKNIDSSYTLFIDRDGVINNERPGDYVRNWQQFEFSAGVLEALSILSKKVALIIVVSNQRGVGRQLMTGADLEEIHRQMQKEVLKTGGRIDHIYYCTDTEKESFYRKPNPGMAYSAFMDFPSIDRQKCIMIGNKPGDMRFGRSAGMFTIFITSTNPDEPFPHPDVDAQFPSLLAFAAALES